MVPQMNHLFAHDTAGTDFPRFAPNPPITRAEMCRQLF